MSVEIRADTRGLDRLIVGLSQRTMQTLMNRAALEAEGTAKAKAPVDTGFLRGSIRALPAMPYEATVAVGAEYGAYQEFGTRHFEGRHYLEPSVQKAADHLREALEALFRSAS